MPMLSIHDVFSESMVEAARLTIRSVKTQIFSDALNFTGLDLGCLLSGFALHLQTSCLGTTCS
jgi:hypothetical protein